MNKKKKKTQEWIIFICMYSFFLEKKKIFSEKYHSATPTNPTNHRHYLISPVFRQGSGRRETVEDEKEIEKENFEHDF